MLPLSIVVQQWRSKLLMKMEENILLTWHLQSNMSPGQKMLRSGEQGIDMVLLNFLLRSIDFQSLKNHERNKVLEITRTATYVPALVVLWHNFFGKVKTSIITLTVRWEVACCTLMIFTILSLCNEKSISRSINEWMTISVIEIIEIVISTLNIPVQ